MLDICRMTFSCADGEAVVAVLEKLGKSSELSVVRAKNRLHPAFDASESGGYRYLKSSIHLKLSQKY